MHITDQLSFRSARWACHLSPAVSGDDLALVDCLRDDLADVTAGGPLDATVNLPSGSVKHIDLDVTAMFGLVNMRISLPREAQA